MPDSLFDNFGTWTSLLYFSAISGLAALGGIAVTFLFQIARRRSEKELLDIIRVHEQLEALRVQAEKDPTSALVVENTALLHLMLESRAREKRRSRYVLTIAAVFGIIGLLFTFVYIAALWKRGILEFKVVMVTSAYAQTATATEQVKADLSFVMPYVACGILAVMGVAFITALFVVFALKDVPENQSRIKAAADIVKTFGGFFTGLATTVLSAAVT